MTSRTLDIVTYRSPRTARLLLSHRLFAPVVGAAMLAMIAMPGGVAASANYQPIQAMPVAGVAPVDTDGDGPSDGLEAELGTDPTDRDGDLLSNEQEADLGTDPDDADTDDDGLSDFAEVGFEPGSSTGTDPLDADSDDDGFLDGEEVPAGSDSTDPNSTPGSISLDPDEDGLINEEELEIGTDPNDFDTDGDGLGDGAESREDGWNTNPLKADTDGDGYNDGDELLTYGTDPKDASDFPSGAQSPAPSSSAQPTARPSGSVAPGASAAPSANAGGAVTGLPSTGTGTGTDLTSSSGGLLALLASGVMGTVAAAFGLRRRQA